MRRMATVFQASGFKDIKPPQECSEAIVAFRNLHPNVPIEVICSTPVPDATVTMMSQPCRANVLCCIEVSRKNIFLPDGTVGLEIVFVANIPLHIIVIGNSQVICEFNSFIKIFETDVFSQPFPTNITCRITSIVCNAVFLNEEQIVVSVTICKEIAPIPPVVCPTIGQFPPQCRTIFPSSF